MDEVDSGHERPSDPVSPLDDPTLDRPEVLPDAEVDPRIRALAEAPENAAALIAYHTSGTASRGDLGQGGIPHGAGALTGHVRPPAAAGPTAGRQAAANPIAEQRALDSTGKPAAESGTEGRDLAEKPGAGTPDAAGRQDRGAPEETSESGPASALSELGQGLVDEGLRRVGEAADQSARLYADQSAPGMYDTVKDSKTGGRELDRVEQSRVGQWVPKPFWDGFRGRNKEGGDKKQNKDPRQNASGPGDGSGSGRGKYAVLLAVTLPVLIPGLCILLILALLLGVNAASGDNPSQPDEASDAKVSKYFPEGWQKVLRDAAENQTSSGAPDYAIVPWTVLGGIVATQTDFARYSPYDNVDRDPGRNATPIPTGGGEGGDDATVVGETDGAGPGPISGVTGPGSAASVGPGHPAPPPGDLSHQLGWFLYALRMHESSGNYTAGKGKRNVACGAYQYINSTWNNYGGYPTACDAPPSVQDRRARRDVLAKWNKYHKWQQVAAAHFYPAWATSTQDWDKCPAACNVNPTVWAYVDDLINKMRDISRRYPAGTTTPTVQPATFPEQTGSRPAGAMRAGVSADGVFADGCRVANPTPAIGGKGGQGSGPYLLAPAAAGQMRMAGLDPQNPCEATDFVARQLVTTARRVHDDPGSPRWNPDGTAADQANARKYWSKVIEASGIFVDRSADPDAPCAVPPPDDPKKPWSISFKIISVWRCEATRMPELYLVTGGAYDDRKKMRYTVETDRAAATETLVDEALSVSYGAGRWKTDKCDDRKKERQGVFPMTEKEAEAAGVRDRCDVDENIAGAAKLVLSVEKVEPERRPDGLGPFQPMVGGWQKLGIAMGTDLRLFSQYGPGQRFSASDACTTVMTRFVTAIVPRVPAFAKLKKPPKADDLYSEWETKLTAAEEANGITDPAKDRACMIGSWSPGYNATLAQTAAGLTDSGIDVATLNGLANFYQAKEDGLQASEPVPGSDALVIPRLALRPLESISAPIASDATEAWSRRGSTDGVTIPLDQVAVEYAWFFGGVISPFDSAGKLIGSLADGGGATTGGGVTQVSVGPKGCPKDAPKNTLRPPRGAPKIDIHKLCVDSVRQARTPQAAKAIKWALTHLGIPYCMCVPQRDWDNYADCSSFVSKAYRSAIPNLYQGSSPNTTMLRSVSWTHRIAPTQVKPGDLVQPEPGHVAMALADGYKVHTNRTGDVSKVEKAYSPGEIYWAGWVEASKV